MLVSKLSYNHFPLGTFTLELVQLPEEQPFPKLLVNTVIVAGRRWLRYSGNDSTKKRGKAIWAICLEMSESAEGL